MLFILTLFHQIVNSFDGINCLNFYDFKTLDLFMLIYDDNFAIFTSPLALCMKKSSSAAGRAFFHETACKPGFVVYGNLSALYVAIKL